MNSSPNKTNCRVATVYALVILGAFLIVAALVWAMRHYTTPPSLSAQRAAQRMKTLVEMRAEYAHDLENVGWIDQTKGIVRLPISVAMNLLLTEWQKSPEAARSNLIARVEKATAPAPAPPKKPNPFE